MEKSLLFIGLICSVLLAGVKSTNTRADMVETPVVDNQNVPLLAMFDMTKVNKRIKAYISDAFQNMKGNLTVNIKKEIKNYFDDMKQNYTDDISEAHNHRDCSDLDREHFRSGVYKIFPEGSTGFNVYCDMETDGGGWTVFQRRQDGKVDFYREWKEYVKGFGDVKTEFWLGNDKLHVLTSQGSYELRVDLMDFNGDKAYAKYSTFYIGDQSTNYLLTVNGYSGTAGDALAYHNNQAFSTKDKDNESALRNCAEVYKGAWWYNDCHHANLNGLYLGNRKSNTGMRWHQWKITQSMKTTSMMIHRI
ncbi:Fibrinogen-like protein A,Ryncolin-4,Angiopoietin-related protein 7,Angiopoietin-related protein 1,Ficolin-3,Ficolin-1-B,Techylectin-5A,Ficolin-2,Ryncolin-1,Tenascin-R,Fibrinogen-like protein 1,Angiopoietin-1,Tenascin-X,Fibrinogen C domain-containing protein 1-A,Tenascin-N,Veficolin-1,Ryncolin-3,Tenascin,Fibroleukin, Fibrinogen C domain-containing protein 1,Techylectin-like protein,Ryncolin-2,Angiopoietin-related protein 6,Techylectin-5B,Angiopoietin-related protein 2,Angiopoietin-2,Microfibril-associated|uniref:Fibrinogen C-terminal domain-containing protein n=1 Tax=Mytilus coruscus TaxID=42192 RepID=A0A6J8C0L3_MYTCO|nr:Fibrinogen-like protein A,Ryncolin-4,Angiopoietin-related protein 7,Angiopoietin-related protein 1,Ficolin-3,Ficolin-1-B,Techylectin-5A,Ficolin-2,Ryncolin-1,Tenascin-R,Fibrinogen-like protein 1,Angiopoietin-1,Tenascin-X,Fibrinogen C domain-containing protein 1-A,Tenascin-N,Veficolin-1,Ryncolin-3,Tenascin,Fibroleukin, Fibrinogen C domain-containing protein 1,Techylectin-like protein,Ryncolin-2,Angiopoietin-related protein 6,Techylectin-5B,Angiopoietin-related protein 2,Angiopoietin-2,Microfibril-